ncbi:hypothetical protein LTR53_015512 [Teratosphaeriaceae sp. CCFEE 6253]|nr:hypothetical protein LTR53_015512 [Teratosphaeriaceae sp. CCFEE 6253]
MPFGNRLSKAFSRSEKEKEAEAEAERNKSDSGSSTPPPSYAPPAYDADNALDPPDMTAGFSKLNLGTKNKDSFPSTEEGIAHLKLLECFYRLKQQIGARDGLFGINDAVVTSRIPREDEAAELLVKLAEKRWAVYLARAVDRFDVWLRTLMPNAKLTTVAHVQALGDQGVLCDPESADPALRFSKEDMPPVDVLMVWHAYMLNPRAYLEDCIRLGRMALWHTDMPWQTVVAWIDSATFAYQPDEEAESLWTRSTGLPWDNLGNMGKSLICPGCNANNPVAWTEASANEPSANIIDAALPSALDVMLTSGAGYCDRDMTFMCAACPAQLNHKTLATARFCADIRRLLDHHCPIGGSVFGLDGMPGKVAGYKGSMAQTMLALPNNLLSEGLGAKILATRKAGGAGSNETMEVMREVLEEAMRDKAYMRKVRQSAAHRMQRSERIAIRRMMSRYWDNSSPFALDLVGAVVRQGTFIEKMHHIDWLHSPALPSTMSRLIIKYGRFVQLMADKTNMAVPTLDVDLAWHTHQLSPHGYLVHTVTQTAQFIDHDDKVAETRLNDAFAWTSKTYTRLFNEPYSECTCWYCEAVRESSTSASSRLFRGAQAKAQDALLHKVPQDPAKSVHISAHNAVRPTDNTAYTAQAAKQAAELDKAYAKACARAKKQGRGDPKRDDYYYSSAWGYPVFIPAYSPYVGYVGYAPYYYPVTPGCMAVGAGAAGNCCALTCGGGVAAGSCGGAGGCASGAAGGCGGGGGAGGFGGCGGGGGGGGCGGGGGGGGGGCGGGGGGGC